MDKITINCVTKDGVEIPKYETDGASGMDLRAYGWAYCDDPKTTNVFTENNIFVLRPLQRILVKTGLSVELPENYEAQVRPRSGTALKYGVTVLNTPGTIDEDYRGEIGVILVNLSDVEFIIHKGDRIAQLVFQKVEKVELNKVNQLSDTKRGSGAYNSTGVK